MSSVAKKVLVLMSGGVDSSLAAAILQRQGWQVTGLTLRLREDSPAPGEDAGCADFAAAAAVTAQSLGIPHRVLDLRDRFRRLIVEPFVETYSRGRTPNPCVLCNPLVKFAAAMEVADDIGAGRIASGHYGRVLCRPGEPVLLRKGRDVSRDQSYFLYRLPQEVLSRLLFPLGELNKDQVRAMARELNLPAAEKEDSQEICFVEPEGLASFLQAHLPASSRRPGAIKDKSNRVLGRHQGIHLFTVGQRRGLGLAVGRPLYVCSIDPATGTIMVGEEGDLNTAAFLVEDLHWSVSPPAGPWNALVRIRYRHVEAPARIQIEGSGARVIFETPQRAVTPGQSAVFYREECVVGGGLIAGPVGDTGL